MSDDLVARLQSKSTDCHQSEEALYSEAAARITELEAEVCILRDVLLNPDPDQEPDNVRLHREKCDALDRALAAESQLERVRAETWEEIGTAPKDGTRVLLVRGDNPSMHTAFWRDDVWHCGGHQYFNKPTHWRPLPAPPQQKTEGV